MQITQFLMVMVLHMVLTATAAPTLEKRLSFGKAPVPVAKPPAVKPPSTGGSGSSSGGGILGGLFGKGKTTPAATPAAAKPTPGGGIVSKFEGLFGSKKTTAATSPTAKPATSQAAATTKAVSESTPPATSTLKQSTSSASKSSTASSSSTTSSETAGASCALPPKKAARSVFVERAATGIEVCGIPFRDGDLPATCLLNPVSFTFDGTTLTKVTSAAAANTACDHALELQVLSQTLTKNGACAAMDGMLAAGGVDVGARTTAKQTALQPLFLAINGQSNAFSLDSKVNGVKALVVAAGVAGKTALGTAQDPNVLKAIDAYLKDASVLAESTALATSLDTLTVAAVNAVAQTASNAVNCLPTGSARQRTAKDNKVAAIADKKATFVQATATVTQAWNRVKALAQTLGA